ncbi:uncharacterized protein PAC_14676 [Phialocephala subalpina]|uniref:SH3 domain-containing protein n=1 Tax=Phialocephala subalpina TaxID=576137 RepID=A0A1L7XIJ2_9HELO|nr:uncharacterized protein PAC_14676 [Phialocephala subalpina]
MESSEAAPVEASGGLGLQSARGSAVSFLFTFQSPNSFIAANSSGGSPSGAIRGPNPGVEGRFELKERGGAETLRYSRPDAVTASFESEIQGSVVYLHKLSQPNEYYIVRGTPSITQLLSQPGPAKYMANLPDYETGDPHPDLVWIHLPANNMSWVEALATVRYKEAMKTSAPTQPVGANKDPVGQLFLLSPGVWTQRQYNGSFTQPSKQERFLQPLYSGITTLSAYTIPVERDISPESESKPNSVAFMPYIHWEQSDKYLLRNKCLDWMLRKDSKEAQEKPGNVVSVLKHARADETATNSWTAERANKELVYLSRSLDIDSKLLLAYVHEDSPLHVRRTLDQSFYYTLPDEEIRIRDLDQVLYRYTNGDLKMTAPRILMVDQLWLWIIDEPGQPRTVITAFPQSWGTIPLALGTTPIEPSSRPPALPSPDLSVPNQIEAPGVPRPNIRKSNSLPPATPIPDPVPNLTRANPIHEAPSGLSASHTTTNLPVTGSWQPRCRALCDFTGEGDNKTSFKKDDALTLLKKGTNGWSLIESGTGKGWAPSSYLDREAPSPGAAVAVQDEGVPTIEHDRSQIYGRIFSALLQPDVEKSSAEDVVSLIIDKCSGLFHPCHDEIDHMLDYLEVFAIAIGKAADSQTTLYNALCSHSTRLQKLQERLRHMSSASLRERWGRQDEPKTSKSAQGPKTPVRVFSSATQSNPKAKTDPSIAEQWSSFHEPANTVETPTDEFPNISEALKKGTILEIEHLIEHEMNELVDITKETERMKEIKDILDELNIISSIFKQQLKIVKAMAGDQADGRTPSFLPSEQPDPSGKGKGIEIPNVRDNLQNDTKHSTVKYAKLYQTLKGREQDIEDLKTEGTRVYKSICDLLDLKQKQASVSEAYSARQEARESARQGKTILVFTIVTIVFLPLSFIAAIFSMNATEINAYAGRTIRGWFLIGLFTWERHRDNQALKTAVTPAKTVPPTQNASGQGTASSSGTSVKVSGGTPTEARQRVGFSRYFKRERGIVDRPPGQAAKETV